jgi:hypothetical protein
MATVGDEVGAFAEFQQAGHRLLQARLTFNPWHGLKVHMPLGGINRARRDVMTAMQDVRLKANGQMCFGPHELTGNETFPFRN